MTTFKSQLDNAYKKKVLGTLSKTVRAVALTVDEELVKTTPVDTGRARANWQVSLNEPITSEVDWSDGDVSVSIFNSKGSSCGVGCDDNDWNKAFDEAL